VLRGWRLRFNVAHFFPHEGGMGNIVPSPDADASVWGALHALDDEALALLDQAELYPHGYDRVPVQVLAPGAGGLQSALAYVGTPGFVDERCRPTQRYLNILLKGARAMGLDESYVQQLQAWPLHTHPEPAPFVPPAGPDRVFDSAELATLAQHTALDGHVFDMSQARWQHRLLWGWFGGRDMTLFHLRRLDSADGSETPQLARLGGYSPAQRRCLDAYLQAYLDEYRYAGRFVP
jgi:AIG2-like family